VAYRRRARGQAPPLRRPISFVLAIQIIRGGGLMVLAARALKTHVVRTGEPVSTRSIAMYSVVAGLVLVPASLLLVASGHVLGFVVFIVLAAAVAAAVASADERQSDS
jgi:uncharacterized membrane protein YdjX (TVP38/TMEM64 family)